MIEPVSNQVRELRCRNLATVSRYPANPIPGPHSLIQTLEQLNRYPILFQQEILSHYRLSIKCINELRLDAVVQNTKKLLDNIHGFEDQIRNDVEHNYCRFLELGQENCFRIEQVIKKQQLDCDIYDAVPLEIPIHKFQLIEETAIIDSLSDL